MYTILDSNLEIVGILDLEGRGCKFYNDLRSTKIADEQGNIWSDTLTLSVPYGYRETEFMTQGYHLLKEGNDGNLYCYRIFDWTDDAIGPTHVKTIQAINLLAWDLWHTNVSAKKFINATSQTVFEYILQRTGWEINDDDFLGGAKTLDVSAGNNAMYWLDQFTTQFGVEIRAFVQIYNGKIVRKLVDTVQELGDSHGRRVEYSHDLTGISRKGSDQEMYTKLFVYGGNDKNGIPISIASVNNGQPYIVDEDANDLHNNGGDYLEGYIVNEAILNPSGLLDWGKEQMSKWNHPKYAYTIDIAHLDYIPNLGDHIQVLDFSMQPELTISARVLQYNESEANPLDNKVVLGEFIEIIAVTPSDILRLQADADRAAKQSKTYKVDYFSPDGTDFSNGASQKRIIVRVYDGKENVTASLDERKFIWQKINPDGTYDEVWAESYKNVGNVITVGKEVTGCVVRCRIEDSMVSNVAVYFQNGIDYVVDDLSKVQNDNTLSALFITDTHYATSSANMNNLKSRSIVHMQNVSYLTNSAEIDVVVHGGDLIDGDEPKNLMMTDLQDAAESLHSYTNSPLLFMIGNHDDNSWYANDNDSNLMRSVIQPLERYNILKKYLDTGIVQNASDKESMYYYKDFPTQKIRIICLNSFDNPYTTQSNGTNKYKSMYQSAFRNAQLNWIANTALKLPATGWSVLLFTHAPLQGTFNSDTQINSTVLYGILDAFMKGISYTGTGNTVDYTCSVSCNYTTQGTGEIIAVISGHVHYDSSMIKNGMRCIQTINSLARNDFEGTMPDRPLITLLEDAWDVFTIDRSKRKIFATRFGAGNNREFTY